MHSLIPVLLVITNMQALQPVVIKTAGLEIELLPRTPDQIGSFYEARGFSREMVSVIKQQCYITVGITNHSNDRIWLELANWTFSAAGRPLRREHRDYWKQRWVAMDIPPGKQSTFRWTLLPESLDYLPGEHEGGNILLPFTSEPVSLTATFATGDDKQGTPITITTDKLFCAEDPP